MNTIKENLHTIIDNFDDDEFLSAVYEILQSKQDSQPGKIWETLDEEQKKVVIEAANNTDKLERQINHARMVEKNKKWLEK